MAKNTGGSAFPESYIGADRPHEGIGDGMTLRDYFAAKAMQGLLAQSQGSALGSQVTDGASYAYAIADAMLKEREK